MINTKKQSIESHQYLKETLRRNLSLLRKKERVRSIKISSLFIEEEAAPENNEAAGEEGGEEGGKKDNLSDISEEEEIKIPPKDLTGKYSLEI